MIQGIARFLLLLISFWRGKAAKFVGQQVSKGNAGGVFPVGSHDLYAHGKPFCRPTDRSNRGGAAGKRGRSNPVEHIYVMTRAG